MESTSLGQLILTGVPGTNWIPRPPRFFAASSRAASFSSAAISRARSQLRKLIDDLRDLSEVEPIITIDQEGGRVSRLAADRATSRRMRNNCATRTMSPSFGGTAKSPAGFCASSGSISISVRCSTFPSMTRPTIRCAAAATARRVEQVVSLAGAFNDALRGQGIASCGKHFPGYSAATVDAHHDLPKIERTRDELDEQELAVFRHFVAAVDSMMICHGWYPCFNAEKTPASLSRADRDRSAAGRIRLRRPDHDGRPRHGRDSE